MKTSTVKLPAFLGSALVNGDTSGLKCTCGAERPHQRDRDPSVAHGGGCDFRWLAAAHEYVAPGHIAGTASNPCDCPDDTDHTVECASRESAEAYFSPFNDLPCFNRGCDVVEYTVLYPSDK